MTTHVVQGPAACSVACTCRTALSCSGPAQGSILWATGHRVRAAFPGGLCCLWKSKESTGLGPLHPSVDQDLDPGHPGRGMALGEEARVS